MSDQTIEVNEIKTCLFNNRETSNDTVKVIGKQQMPVGSVLYLVLCSEWGIFGTAIESKTVPSFEITKDLYVNQPNWVTCMFNPLEKLTLEQKIDGVVSRILGHLYRVTKTHKPPILAEIDLKATITEWMQTLHKNGKIE